MLCSMWDLPGPGLEPVSPALAGGFLTTAPPGKSKGSFLSVSNVLVFIVLVTVVYLFSENPLSYTLIICLCFYMHIRLQLKFSKNHVASD